MPEISRNPFYCKDSLQTERSRNSKLAKVLLPNKLGWVASQQRTTDSKGQVLLAIHWTLYLSFWLLASLHYAPPLFHSGKNRKGAASGQAEALPSQSGSSDTLWCKVLSQSALHWEGWPEMWTNNWDLGRSRKLPGWKLWTLIYFYPSNTFQMSYGNLSMLNKWKPVETNWLHSHLVSICDSHKFLFCCLYSPRYSYTDI